MSLGYRFKSLPESLMKNIFSKMFLFLSKMRKSVCVLPIGIAISKVSGFLPLLSTASLSLADDM